MVWQRAAVYFAAGIATILVLIILIIIKPYKKLICKKSHKEVYLKLDKEKVSLAALDEIITAENLSYRNIRINNSKDDAYTIEILFDKSVQQSAVIRLIDKLNDMNGIHKAELRSSIMN